MNADDDQVRAAFSEAAAGPEVDADALLDRVHRGGRRRGARRTAGVIAVAAGAVAVVTAAVAALAPGGATDDTVAAAGSGTRAVPSELAVYDVHAAEDAVWALASGDCGRTQLCAVLARSTDEGVTWRLGRPQLPSGDDALAELRHLDVSDDGQYVLAAGRGAATSRDAGATWHRVGPAAARPLRGVAVGAARAVLVLDEPGAGALLTASTGSDDWAAVDARVGPGEQLVEPFAAGPLAGAAVLTGRAQEATALVVDDGSGAGWTRLAAPCATRTPLVASDGATVWYVCYGPSGSVVATSTDVGAAGGPATWTTTELPAARTAGMGTLGGGAAVVATEQRLFRVDAWGEVTELTGEGTGLDLAADDYTYRAAAGSWLASFRGLLFHRADDGTWGQVPVP